ncbi:hypothetical protein ACS0TY_020796 [Phlomoides rotata]
MWAIILGCLEPCSVVLVGRGSLGRSYGHLVTACSHGELLFAAHGSCSQGTVIDRPTGLFGAHSCSQGCYLACSLFGHGLVGHRSPCSVSGRLKIIFGRVLGLLGHLSDQAGLLPHGGRMGGHERRCSYGFLVVNLGCSDLEFIDRIVIAMLGCGVLAPNLENWWSDVVRPEELKVTNWSNMGEEEENWYCYGKAVAEQAAWDTAKELGVDLVVINPVLVLGPLLQPTVNASVLHILKYLTGSAKTYANSTQAYVHVKDVALAHILLFETPSASGRYLCAESVLHRGDVVEILAKFFPEYPIPTKCSDEKNPRKKPYNFSNQKLKDLGLEFTPVKQSLYDTVKSLQEKGHLPIPTQNEKPLHIQS